MPAVLRRSEGSPVQLVRTTTFKVETETERTAMRLRRTPARRRTLAAAPAPRKAKLAAACRRRPEDARQATATERSGWIIQIGATDSQTAAPEASGQGPLDRPSRAWSRPSPSPNSVERNGSTLWRARFAGFNDQRQAQAACAALKSKDFECMAARL